MAKERVPQNRPPLSLVPPPAGSPSGVSGNPPAPRNPLAPISFASTARRPSFDLAAELVAQAEELAEQTEGDEIQIRNFPVYLIQSMDTIVLKAQAMCSERDRLHGEPLHLPINRNTLQLACINYAIGELEKMAEGFKGTRETLLKLTSDNGVDDDLLEYVLSRSEEIGFKNANKTAGDGQTICLRVSPEKKKHIVAAGFTLGFKKPQMVSVLAVAYTFGGQHHLVNQSRRNQATELLRQYELRAIVGRTTIKSDLQMVLAAKEGKRLEREREEESKK